MERAVLVLASSGTPMSNYAFGLWARCRVCGGPTVGDERRCRPCREQKPVESYANRSTRDLLERRWAERHVANPLRKARHE